MFGYNPYDWNTIETSLSFGSKSLTILEPIFITPSVKSSNPAIILMVVVFPHPDGPRRTRNSLSLIIRLKFLTALKSPQLFETFINSISAID